MCIYLEDKLQQNDDYISIEKSVVYNVIFRGLNFNVNLFFDINFSASIRKVSFTSASRMQMM